MCNKPCVQYNVLLNISLNIYSFIDHSFEKESSGRVLSYNDMLLGSREGCCALPLWHRTLLSTPAHPGCLIIWIQPLIWHYMLLCTYVCEQNGCLPRVGLSLPLIRMYKVVQCGNSTDQFQPWMCTCVRDIPFCCQRYHVFQFNGSTTFGH